MGAFPRLPSPLLELTLPQYLQSFYTLTAATVLVVSSIPLLSARFLPYGKTAEPIQPTQPTQSTQSATAEQKQTPTINIIGYALAPSATGVIDRSLRYLAVYQVPHSYFAHFYIVSIASSVFWGWQIFSHGSMLAKLLDIATPTRGSLTQSMERIYLAWVLLLAQGIRRYYETAYVLKPSSSRMWIGHYIAGVLFYAATGVAIWAEGAETLRQHHPKPLQFLPIFRPLPLIAPSLRTIIILPVFILASGLQSDCHVYLSTLKKYTLPNALLFQYIICPHYFTECLIYLSIAILTAPPGQLVNRTMLSATVFVYVLLGVSAANTKKWYEAKFGKESVKGRYKMIPLLY